MAFWIAMVIPPAVSVLDTVFAYVTKDVMAASINAALEQYSVEALPSQDTDWIFTPILLTVLVALWIAFGFQLRAGRNWARVTLTVFAAVWLCGELLGIVLLPAVYAALGLPSDFGLSTGMVISNWLSRALALFGTIAFMILVFRKPSNQYIQAARHFHAAKWHTSEMPQR